MPAEKNLAILLSMMSPTLQEGEFVFCSVDPQIWRSPKFAAVTPIGLFQEIEGLTLILSRQQADTVALPYTATFRMITLAVHSSLEAVGFLAAITTHLATYQISVNPVSAFYHDHLFIPSAQAEQAMQILHSLAQAVITSGETV